eukprot:g1039.t1
MFSAAKAHDDLPLSLSFDFLSYSKLQNIINLAIVCILVMTPVLGYYCNPYLKAVSHDEFAYTFLGTSLLLLFLPQIYTLHASPPKYYKRVERRNNNARIIRNVCNVMWNTIWQLSTRQYDKVTRRVVLQLRPLGLQRTLECSEAHAFRNVKVRVCCLTQVSERDEVNTAISGTEQSHQSHATALPVLDEPIIIEEKSLDREKIQDETKSMLARFAFALRKSGDVNSLYPDVDCQYTVGDSEPGRSLKMKLLHVQYSKDNEKRKKLGRREATAGK